jgi:hypothetical protein
MITVSPLKFEIYSFVDYRLWNIVGNVQDFLHYLCHASDLGIGKSASAVADSLAQDLAKRFPLDTQVQSFWLPAIQAELALARKESAAAIDHLQAAAPMEFGQIQFNLNISCLYPVYVRGEAYLAEC